VEKQPTLYHALPALEELQSMWEAKVKEPKYSLYHDVIEDGLTKLGKYYSKFDNKPAYILALGELFSVALMVLILMLFNSEVLHPYFKM